MKTTILASVLALALAGCATDATTTGAGAGAPEASAQVVSAGLPNSGEVPPEVAAWAGDGFYPPEFCWKVQTWSRDMPRYWKIRDWCDERDNNPRIWEPD